MKPQAIRSAKEIAVVVAEVQTVLNDMNHLTYEEAMRVAAIVVYQTCEAHQCPEGAYRLFMQDLGRLIGREGPRDMTIVTPKTVH